MSAAELFLILGAVAVAPQLEHKAAMQLGAINVAMAILFMVLEGIKHWGLI